MRYLWPVALALCLASVLQAEDTAWQPSGPAPVQGGQGPEAARDAPGAPAVTLGRPVPLEAEPTPSGSLLPVSYDAPAGSSVVVAQAQPGDPGASGIPAPPPTSPAIVPSPAEQYNCGVATQAPGTSHPFWDKTKEFVGEFPWFGKGEYDAEGHHHLFQSDHAFDDFASPVSNPIYFEDPRSLTEFRPLFIYQDTPNGNYVFHGGGIELLNFQGRVALNECWSLVVSELGVIWMDPRGSEPGFEPHVGLAQITLGPKWTFLRNETTGTLAAAGLNFVIPAGEARVFQDTGSLSLEPYLSAGQRFCHIPNWGTFHALGTLGFNISVNDERTDNFFFSLHLDFDYGDLHKIYPLIELTNFVYLNNGNSRNLDFEGADLANFGSSHVSGQDELSLALGLRFKLNEMIQTGFALEFPLVSNHDLMNFRLTFDLIFRF
jgi:hypothetical protein